MSQIISNDADLAIIIITGVTISVCFVCTCCRYFIRKCQQHHLTNNHMVEQTISNLSSISKNSELSSNTPNQVSDVITDDTLVLVHEQPSSTVREEYINALIHEYIDIKGDLSPSDVRIQFNNFSTSTNIKSLKDLILKNSRN